jgi:hypothetical protein
MFKIFGESSKLTKKILQRVGANRNIEIKKDKRILLNKLKEIDRMEEDNGFSSAQWQERYGVEKQLE